MSVGGARRWRGAVLVVCLTVFLDFTGLTMVVPLLPLWADALGASAPVIGVLAAAYAVTQLLATPLLGALSDRVGRRTVILGSVLVSAVSFGVAAMAQTVALLLLARLLGGLGGANVGAAQAVVADVVPPAERARAMGWVGVPRSARGTLVGPAAAGLLGSADLALPFWVATAVAVVNAVVVAALLPETGRPVTPGPAPRPRRRPPVETWRSALAVPGLRPVLVVSAVFMAAFMAVESMFALFTRASFGWGPAENGWVFTYIGAVVVAAQLGGVARVVDRLGQRGALLAGLALLTVGLALLGAVPVPAVTVVALTVVSLGVAPVTVLTATMASVLAPAESQGQVLGLTQAVTGLGRLAGPLLAGALFPLAAAAPFLAAAALGAVAIAVAAASRPSTPRPDLRTHA